MRLSKEIKIRIVLLFAKFESPMAVIRALKAEGYKEIPTENSIRSFYARFCQNGSVEDLPRFGRPKIFQETQKTQVEAILAENPKASLSEIAAQVQLSKTSIFNFKKTLSNNQEKFSNQKTKMSVNSEKNINRSC